MSSSSEVKLNDIASFQNGGGWTADKYSDSGIPVVRVSDIHNETIDLSECKYLPERLIDKYKKHELKEDDLVICTVGSHPTQPNSVVGRSCRVPSKVDGALLNQNAVRIRPDIDKLDKIYLAYLGASDMMRNHIIAHARGSASQVRMSIGNLKKFTFELPPIETQQKIASILSAFDDLIENNSRRIEILEEMARRIYREWFVHFRYPGYEDDELVDSGTDEFDAVPEGWNMQVMDEILEHYIGGTWGKEEPEDEKNNPAYVIRGTDIPGGRSGNVDDIPLRYHKQSYINSRKLQHGDIVFEVSGGSKGQPVGRAMLITDTFLTELNCEDVVHASFCKLLRSDKSILKPEILYLHIREIYDDRRIMKYQVQSTGISNFKFTFFAENKQMFIPPIDLQEKFQEKVSPLFKQMYILGKQINRLKETRDLLLPKLISGKVDVEAV